MNYPFKEKVAIHCPTPEYSEQVQEVLFKLGCKWVDGETNVKSTDKSWLFADDGEITWWDYNHNNSKEVDLKYLKSLLNKEENKETQKLDMIVSPKHYQLFPEFNLEIKDINKRILDNMEESNFDITLYEAGWYQQSMQYFERFYLKNGIEDLKKGIQTMQFVIDSMEQRKKE